MGSLQVPADQERPAAISCVNACHISVIIPTRNRLEKLQRALISVDQQSYHNYEVLIIDDGSTDGTLEFLTSGELERRFTNIPATCVLTTAGNLGAAAARNLGIAKASGELLAFLDDDDVWLPGYLEFQAKRIRESQAAASVIEHVEMTATGQLRKLDFRPLVEYSNPLVYLLSESFVHTMSVFACRRELFTTLGPLDETLSIVHDWDWYARILMSGHTLLLPTGPPLVRREVPGGLVSQYRRWHTEEISILNRYLDQQSGLMEHRRAAGAHRALVFGRQALANRDFVFALRMVREAFLNHPLHAIRIIALRIGRIVGSATKADRWGT